MPAALAAGERFAISGARLVAAVALGYHVGPRVTMTLGGLPFQIIRKRRPFNPDDVRSVDVRVATSEAKTVNDREIKDLWTLRPLLQRA